MDRISDFDSASYMFIPYAVYLYSAVEPIADVDIFCYTFPFLWQKAVD